MHQIKKLLNKLYGSKSAVKYNFLCTLERLKLKEKSLKNYSLRIKPGPKR